MFVLTSNSQKPRNQDKFTLPVSSACNIWFNIGEFRQDFITIHFNHRFECN